jgi:hypothetical protein
MTTVPSPLKRMLGIVFEASIGEPIFYTTTINYYITRQHGQSQPTQPRSRTTMSTSEGIQAIRRSHAVAGVPSNPGRHKTSEKIQVKELSRSGIPSNPRRYHTIIVQQISRMQAAVRVPSNQSRHKINKSKHQPGTKPVIRNRTYCAMSQSDANNCEDTPDTKSVIATLP